MMEYYRQKIKSILKDNIAKRKMLHQKSGRLSSSLIYKAVLGSDRVFEKAVCATDKEYHIALVCDFSGSMVNHGRSRPAGLCLHRVSNMIADHCDVKIYGFNRVIHRVNVKRFCQISEEAAEKFVEDSTSLMPHSAGNHDGYTIDFVVKELAHLTGRKIVIVLSDGQPSCDPQPLCKEPGCNNRTEMRKELIRAVRKATDLGFLIVGLGIDTDVVKEFYPINAMVDTDTVLPTVIEVLDKLIKRG